MKRKRIFSNFIIGIAIILTLIPFLWIWITSFKFPKDILTSSFLFVPTLQNYLKVFFNSASPFPKYFFNTVIVSVFSVVFSIVIACPAAYSLTRFSYPYNLEKHILNLLLFMRMVLPVALAIPFFKVMSFLNLYDTLTAIVIVNIAYNLPIAIWILKAFFEDIPKAIEEAAKIDGCSPFNILIKIAIPMIKPGLAAASTFMFLLTWNNFLFSATLGASPKAMTVPVGLAGFIHEHMIHWGTLSAGAAFSTVPVFAFVFIIQKHLVKGFSLGGFKE